VNLIASVCIAIGVMALIAVYSIMSGFQKELRDSIRGTYSHVIVKRDEMSAPASPSATEDIMEIVRSSAHVKEVAPRIPSFGMIGTQGTFTAGTQQLTTSGILIFGIDPSRERGATSFREGLVRAAAARPSHAVENVDDPFAAALRYGEAAGGAPKPGVVLGDFLASKLKVRRGDVITLGSFAFGPDGDVVERSGRFFYTGAYKSDMHDYDAAVVFMPFSAAEEFLGKGFRYPDVELYVGLDDYSNAAAVKAELAEKLRSRRYAVETWEDRQQNFLKAVETEKRMMAIILCFIVIVAAGSILAIQTMMVVEKTRDIGILKALGGTTKGIQSIFLLNGLSIGILGAVLGLVLGLIVTDNINPIHDFIGRLTGYRVFSPEIYVFDRIPTNFEPFAIALFTVGTVVVSVAASLYPAFRASRLKPVEALRYE
jgi:lipoprotein-releasing system permease protein